MRSVIFSKVLRIAKEKLLLTAEPGEHFSRSALTERQRDVFEFLREMIVSHGYGPTVREIGQHFKINSPNGVMSHLKALEKKGLISRKPGMSRAIQLTDPPQPQAALIHIGDITMGQALKLDTNATTRLEFSSLFASKSHCCVRVVGHGLLDDHIIEGDYLSVRRQSDCRDGELILGIADDTGVTVKRYYRETRRIRLESLNRRSPSLFATKVKIIGLVVGVIRQF